MLRHLFVLLSVCLLALGVCAEEKKNPVVVVETSLGEFEVELYADKAPDTVKNFLAYTNEKFFDGTIFHRVIEGFMIQGGGHLADMTEKPVTHPPIKNEADNGLKNDTGTIAMARTSEPNSASAQWFINVNDNAPLNHTGKNNRGWGYAVFGKVTKGMEVVNKIKNVKTGDSGPHQNVPTETVTIKSVKEKK